MTLQAALQNFMDRPGASTARAVHSAVTTSAGFESAARWEPRAQELSQQGRHDEVIRLINGWMPGVFFCIPAHQMLSYSYLGIDDRGNARRHNFYAQLAISAIEQTGDGTKASPWQVLHVTDEYAFLRSKGLEPVSQRMEAVGEGVVDVISCTDGSERWFGLVAR